MIVIAGGIGAGKSVVSRVLRLRGAGVYDCDSRARILMDESRNIVSQMIEYLGEEVVDADGKIDRKATAEIIFSDTEKRRWLNSVVHRAVRDDISAWCASDASNIYVESAIPAESGLLEMTSEVWYVDASEEERVERVMTRSGLSAEEVRRRISSQRYELERIKKSGVAVKIIDNSSYSSLLTEI